MHSLHTLNVPKEALLLVVIWTHLEWRIIFSFFSNVNNIAKAHLSDACIAVFLQILAHLSLCDLPRTPASTFSPPVTLRNCDCQRNHNSWHVKPDYLYYYYYYYISWSILCPALSPDQQEHIPSFHLLSLPFPSSPPAFASYGARNAYKVRVHTLHLAIQQRDSWLSRASQHS